MMRILSRLPIFVITVLVGQDPLVTLPSAYVLERENNYVKVTRVHYAPHEKIPTHDHTLRAAAYVYLNDAGPVEFTHIGLSYGAVTRPATTAGSYRLYRAVQETHEVYNKSDLPSDFLRIELKTSISDENTLRGRYHRKHEPNGAIVAGVEFEDSQLRITRLISTRGKRFVVPPGPFGPTLLVALSPARTSSGELTTAAKHELRPGQTDWQPSGIEVAIESTSEGSAEVLRFEFKTKPTRD